MNDRTQAERFVRVPDHEAHDPAEPALARKTSSLQLLCVALATAMALWILVTTVNISRAGWVPTPTLDDWDRWITYLAEARLDWFFHLHTDHRLVVPKVLFEADRFLFHARGWFPLVCTFCFQLLTGAMLWRFSGRTCRQDRWERWILAAAIVACLFSGQQWFNFVMPFQVQFPMVYCAATAAWFFLWQSAEQADRHSFWIAATIAAATLATYSMANGVLLWPVLLLAAFWLRLPRRSMVALAAGAILLAGPFFYHWDKSSEPIYGMAATERFERTLVFWFGHLGSPLSPLAQLAGGGDAFHITFAAIPGFLLAIALLVIFVRVWRVRERYSSARGLLVFYAAYLAGTSATIAFGRAGDLTEIFTSRYLTPAYIFWVCMLLAAWPWLRRFPRAALYALLCVAMFAGVAMHQQTMIDTVRNWRRSIRPSELAIVNNVVDTSAWHFLFHAPENTFAAIDYLRAYNLTIFSEEWTHWPGASLKRRFFIDRNPDACQGEIEEASHVPSPWKPGWRISGFAWDVKAARPPRYIVFADETGQVAGVAVTAVPPSGTLNGLDTKYLAGSWMGYVNGLPRPITAYVVEADNRSLCAIGSRPLSTPSTEVEFTELGAPFPDAGHETNSWTYDGYFQGRGGPGAPPVQGAVFGSFPDSNTGTLRLGPFRLDGHTEIAIPLVTGPDNQNLSIAIRDAATKEILSIMDPPPVHTTWWAWHPELALGHGRTIEVFVVDQGSTWGQWIALGWPHVLKTK